MKEFLEIVREREQAFKSMHKLVNKIKEEKFLKIDEEDVEKRAKQFAEDGVLVLDTSV